MYLPPAFREEDLGTLHAFVQQYSLPRSSRSTMACRLPVTYPCSCSRMQALCNLIGIWPANPQWQDFATGQEDPGISGTACLCVALLVYGASQCADVELRCRACLWHAAGDNRQGGALRRVARAGADVRSTVCYPMGLAVPDSTWSMMQGIVGFACLLAACKASIN